MAKPYLLGVDAVAMGPRMLQVRSSIEDTYFSGKDAPPLTVRDLLEKLRVLPTSEAATKELIRRGEIAFRHVADSAIPTGIFENRGRLAVDATFKVLLTGEERFATLTFDKLLQVILKKDEDLRFSIQTPIAIRLDKAPLINGVEIPIPLLLKLHEVVLSTERLAYFLKDAADPEQAVILSLNFVKDEAKKLQFFDVDGRQTTLEMPSFLMLDECACNLCKTIVEATGYYVVRDFTKCAAEYHTKGEELCCTELQAGPFARQDEAQRKADAICKTR